MLSPIVIGSLVRTGVYVLGEWKPMFLGKVRSISSDQTLAEVDVMSLHGGAPRVHLEQISQLRLEPNEAQIA